MKGYKKVKLKFLTFLLNYYLQRCAYLSIVFNKRLTVVKALKQHLRCSHSYLKVPKQTYSAKHSQYKKVLNNENQNQLT